MRTRVLLVGCYVLSLACAKTEASPSTPPDPKAHPSPSSTGGNAAAPPADASAPAPTGLAPLAKGKRVRITRLYKLAPLEVTVPQDVKLEMRFMDGGDILPRAGLVGAGLDVEVMEPEGGFSTLESQRKDLAKDVTVVQATALPDGYLWLQKYGREFAVIVARPQLKVTCSQSQMKSLATAELAASVCLSLRAAK